MHRPLSGNRLTGASRRARAAPISGPDDDAARARAGELAEQVYDIFGFDRDFIPPAWMGMQAWLEAGVRSEWKPDLVRLAARKVAARKKGGPPHNFRYLGPAIVQEHELAAAGSGRHRPPICGARP